MGFCLKVAYSSYEIRVRVVCLYDRVSQEIYEPFVSAPKFIHFSWSNEKLSSYRQN